MLTKVLDYIKIHGGLFNLLMHPVKYDITENIYDYEMEILEHKTSCNYTVYMIQELFASNQNTDNLKQFDIMDGVNIKSDINIKKLEIYDNVKKMLFI